MNGNDGTQEKNFECSECGKVFGQRGYLCRMCNCHFYQQGHQVGAELRGPTVCVCVCVCVCHQYTGSRSRHNYAMRNLVRKRCDNCFYFLAGSIFKCKRGTLFKSCVLCLRVQARL